MIFRNLKGRKIDPSKGTTVWFQDEFIETITQATRVDKHSPESEIGLLRALCIVAANVWCRHWRVTTNYTDIMAVANVLLKTLADLGRQYKDKVNNERSS